MRLAPFMPRLGLSACLLASGMAVSSQAAEPVRTAASVTRPMAVMELFTSQGCSSCPPADAVLAAHADRKDVLALSFHVDYWDYLGWNDNLADGRFSDRQRAYAEVLGEGVYTPQLIVNGVLQGVGHRESDVARMLVTAKNAETAAGAGFVPLAVRGTANGFHISLEADQTSRARVEGATLHLIWFDKRHAVPIARGENAGRKIVYRNTVRAMQMLGSVNEGRLEVNLPLDALRRTAPSGSGKVALGKQGCALVLQQMDGNLPGPILGAAVIDDLPES